jgi:hypothetical protein
MLLNLVSLPQPAQLRIVIAPASIINVRFMDSIFIIVVFTLNYKVNILVGKNTILRQKGKEGANRLTFSSRYNLIQSIRDMRFIRDG